jgi:cellulose synthase/poly-beta-1,6-N-acetylglucosamine synthase-like glycosyltransferase
MMMYERGWRLQKDYFLPKDFHTRIFISILIPARNEAENIGACIQSILQNNYPESLLEILVIDDHSTDATAAIVASFQNENVKCISLKSFLNENEKINSYKKKAIETGVALSKGELIITTDADCVATGNWLANIASLFQEQKAAMIIGPVAYLNDGKLTAVFQSLDFMSMQGISVAAHRLRLGNMCNGANLAFSKQAFQQVNGYEGVSHLASGDDYLLLTKMQKHFPDKIAYLKSKDAIVSTYPQPNWKSFINQRIRWASKMGKYDDVKITIVLALVYLFNLLFLVLSVLGFFDFRYWLLCILLLAVKTFVELFFLKNVARFYEKRKELWLFPLLQPMHILYIILAGFFGFFGVYQWKGRRVK